MWWAYKLGALALAMAACFGSGMAFQAHRASVARLEEDIAAERGARVLEGQQTRNMARINDALTQDRLATDRRAAGLEQRLRDIASSSPAPGPGCPGRNDDPRPAASVISDQARSDLVALVQDADAVADRLRGCQAVVGQQGWTSTP